MSAQEPTGCGLVLSLRNQLEAARRERDALSEALTYAETKRGSGFDFDEWKRMCDHARKGERAPNAFELEMALHRQTHEALRAVRKERDTLKTENALLVKELRDETLAHKVTRDLYEQARSFGQKVQTLPQRRFDCSTCGPATIVDEDGCCVMCGADTKIINGTEQNGGDAHATRGRDSDPTAQPPDVTPPPVGAAGGDAITRCICGHVSHMHRGSMFPGCSGDGYRRNCIKYERAPKEMPAWLRELNKRRQHLKRCAAPIPIGITVAEEALRIPELEGLEVLRQIIASGMGAAEVPESVARHLPWQQAGQHSPPGRYIPAEGGQWNHECRSMRIMETTWRLLCAIDAAGAEIIK